MVGTFQNSNDMVMYRIAENSEQANSTINDTPVVIFKHQNIKSHDGATSHAWIWIQDINGIVYWVDPTWTDNTGIPYYGIVRDGKEIRLNSHKSLCVR